MTPVPGEAGTMRTEQAPNLPTTVCGIVRPVIGNPTIFRLATFCAFSIAWGTWLDLAYPTPTRPFRSPTTTSEEKLKRRPPLTVAEVRYTPTVVDSRLVCSSSISAMVDP